MAAKYLPSKSLQRNRQKSIPQQSQLRKVFTEAIKGSDFRLESFEPFFKNTEKIKNIKLLDYPQALKTPIGLKLRILLQKHSTGWLALIPLNHVKNGRLLKNRVKQLNFADVRLMDIKVESSQALASYATEAIQWLAWGSLVIAFVLWIGLRSIPSVLRVLLPIVAALILTVGIWILAGTKLNIFHLVSLLLVVGIGIDYALFFIRKTSQTDHHLDYLAILISNVTTVIVFGLLFFAYPLVLKAVGGTVAVGALLAFIISASVAEKAE